MSQAVLTVWIGDIVWWVWSQYSPTVCLSVCLFVHYLFRPSSPCLAAAKLCSGHMLRKSKIKVVLTLYTVLFKESNFECSSWEYTYIPIYHAFYDISMATVFSLCSTVSFQLVWRTSLNTYSKVAILYAWRLNLSYCRLLHIVNRSLWLSVRPWANKPSSSYGNWFCKIKTWTSSDDSDLEYLLLKTFYLTNYWL